MMALVAPVRIVHLVGIGYTQGASGDNCLDIRLKTSSRFRELLMSLLISCTIPSESQMMLY